ncbi:hypothetical protein KIH74_20640 [Kineosporia sp. J2-2]|uniref:Uncharacterized protein n=1 Tax=Kineosporia corallincola TaxID=2835133 RepID=A0ABS5TMQ3_9ACTN|nr:hypothetical protein [Kineosporia corallincola]MBT0771358.1 hypothetical protein [Kineosporia corallincola]
MGIVTMLKLVIALAVAVVSGPQMARGKACGCHCNHPRMRAGRCSTCGCACPKKRGACACCGAAWWDRRN